MLQEYEWEREYRKPTFLTIENKPQSDVVRFVKFLKEQECIIENSCVLDLGFGTGRNSFYFAELGAHVTGLEISETAVRIAKKNANNAGLNITYKKQSIGDVFPVENSRVNILLDITSSNSLSEAEREVYLIESHRVLHPEGYFFVKALCKDGDQNAKNLLKQFPGKEKDTYILPDVGVMERVWTKEDFVETYERYFKIIKLEKKTSYTRMNNRPYKRNFWIAYMKKK
ncbi:MAG: class I SAM-dependent methyltransferase [bacterium]